MKIDDLITAEAEASEAHPDAELRPGTTTRRGHGRSRTLQVRLNADELEALLTMAAARGVHASTLARDLLMKEVRSESADPIAVIARIRADLEALASTVA